MSKAKCEGCLKQVEALNLELFDKEHNYGGKAGLWLCDNCRRDIKNYGAIRTKKGNNE